MCIFITSEPFSILHSCEITCFQLKLQAVKSEYLNERFGFGFALCYAAEILFRA